MPNTEQPTVEQLHEYADNRGQTLAVDREKGVVRNVKLLGLISANNREYTQECVDKALPLYEGCPAFADHVEDGKKHPYRNKLGVHRNVRRTVDGIYGDFHFNPKHPLAEQLCWDAVNDPAGCGFSHDIRARTIRKDGKTIVQEIVSVESVDLVTKPATTSGLFEEELPNDPVLREFCEHALSAVSDARSIVLGTDAIETRKARLQEVLSVWQAELTGTPVTNKENATMEWKDVTLEQLRENRKDLVEVLTGTDATSKLNAEVKTLTEAVAAKDAEAKTLKEELATIKAQEAELAKSNAISEELKAAKLDVADKAACSETFMEQLKAASDADARKRLIEDRVTLVKSIKRSPITTGAPFAQVTDTAVVTNDSLSGLLG